MTYTYYVAHFKSEAFGFENWLVNYLPVTKGHSKGCVSNEFGPRCIYKSKADAEAAVKNYKRISRECQKSGIPFKVRAVEVTVK